MSNKIMTWAIISVEDVKSPSEQKAVFEDKWAVRMEEAIYQ